MALLNRQIIVDADDQSRTAAISAGGEQLITSTTAELNGLTGFGTGTITLDGTTWNMLVDLSNAGNFYPHGTGKTRLDISVVELSIDKSTNAVGSAAIGYISAINGTEGTVVFFGGASFNNSADTYIRQSNNYSDSQIKCATGYISTSAIITTTALNTGLTITGAQGISYTPAVGDIVVRTVKTSGTNMLASYRLLYHGSPEILP